MQINKIQNNSTNFRALKINSKLRPELEGLSLQDLKAIKKLGEDVKGVKLYDVCFEDHIDTPTIRSTRLNDNVDYLKEFKDEEKTLGQHYYIQCDDMVYEGIRPRQPKIFEALFGNLAFSKYELFKGQNKFKQIANLTKMLEKNDLKIDAEIKKYKTEQATKQSKETAQTLEKQHAVDNIMNNHEYVEPKSKDNFISKIFG